MKPAAVLDIGSSKIVCLCGSFVNRDGIRITSYNVCYTKLLRGVYTQNVTLSSDSNNNQNGFFGNFFGGASSVQIAQIVAGSAAEQAGLKAGDLILKSYNFV